MGGRWGLFACLVLGLLVAVPAVPPSGLVPSRAEGIPPDALGHAPIGPAVPASSLTDQPLVLLNYSLAWSSLSSSPGVPRAGAGFAALSALGNGILFGGRTAAGLVNSTVLYNESSDRWTLLSPSRAPSPRSEFGFAADPAREAAVLFGGNVGGPGGAVANDTWTFSLASRNWTNISSSLAPAPRSDPAFAIGDGEALLYGGQNPNASDSGQIVYFDTWLLNLSTEKWEHVPVPSGPGPLMGASLLWDPGMGRFLLFGGCYPCSSAVWAFDPVALDWARIAPSGAVPPARMNADWSFDPEGGDSLLFGGSTPTGVLNDTYLFAPTTAVWTRLAGPSSPPARSSAAADFFDVPGNATLLLTGGTNGSTIFGDVWRLAPVADLTVDVRNATSGNGIADATVSVSGIPGVFTTNASGSATFVSVVAAVTTVNASAPGYAALSRTVWIPPGSAYLLRLNLTPLAPATVVVQVNDPEGRPMSNVTVTIGFGSQLVAGSPILTNATGFARFVQVPSGTGMVNASRPGYHSNSTIVTFPPGATVYVALALSPLAVLHIHILGLLPNGTVAPLEGAQIALAGLPFGTTDAHGWNNRSTLAYGRLSLSVGVYGFFPTSENITIAYSGDQVINVSLAARPFPSVTVRVLGLVGSPVDILVRNARVNVTNTTPLATGPFRVSFLTTVDGAVSFDPPPGNYTVTVWARGFALNDSVPDLHLNVSAVVQRLVYLVELPPAQVDVLVVSYPGAPPIAGATVTLNYTAVNLVSGALFPSVIVAQTTAAGWTNFSGLPSSQLRINVTAPGYYPNGTVIGVEYGELLNPVVIELLAIPPQRSLELALYPGGAAPLLPLLLVPALSIVGVLVYLSALRNPSRRPPVRRPIREEAGDRPPGPPTSSEPDASARET